MQSSPPTRSVPRRASETDSEYTLDLAALELDNDDTDTNIPQQKVERLFSEDIDGPSDFTQNMDLWMRGGSVRRRGTVGKKGTGAQTQTTLEEMREKNEAIYREDVERRDFFQRTTGVKSTLEEMREQNQEDVEQRDFQQQHMEKQSASNRTKDEREEMRETNLHVLDEAVEQRDFLQLPQKETDADDDQTQSHHTPENSPPKDQSQYQDQFSSEWQTDGEGSTPLPPAHKEFLQPTVEDYYSELSPARQPTSSYPGRGRSFGSPTHAQKHSPAKQDESMLGRASSPTLSPERSPITKRASTRGSVRREVEEETTMEIEVEFRQLDEKCQQLENLNQALARALDEERRVRKSEKMSRESESAEAARRERDLVEMKEAAHRHNDEFRREFTQLKEKLLNQQRLADMVRSGDQDNDGDHAKEMLRMNGVMEGQKAEHDKQIRLLEQDLQSARRTRDDAEEQARVARQELEEERDVHQQERERLRDDLYEAHEKESATLQLERQLQDARAEIAELKATNVEAAEQLKLASAELSAEKDVQESEMLRNVTERTRAIDLAAGLQRQLQELKQQMKDGQTKHEAELQRLRSHRDQSGQTSTQELEVIRAELFAKQSELSEAILDRDDAKGSLESLQAGKDGLHNQSDQTSTQDLKAVRVELLAKQTELNETILERDDAQDSLQTLRAEKEALQQRLVEMVSVNSALDIRVTESIQKRETYWKSKVEAANKERELMSKALLHQWGRQEVGVSSPQMYAYKYLSRKGVESVREGDKENRSPRKGKGVVS